MLNIVSTPIGNLDDLSIRQAKTLLNSDLILAEDTRSARILLDAINNRFPQLITNQQPLTAKLISYYKEKEFEKLPEIIALLREGRNIALITESGSPLISDPGYLLVKTAIKNSIPLTVIPGPSAVTTALVLSGFNPSGKEGGYMFLGFFPKKESEILKLLEKMINIKKIFPEMIFICFESSKRITQTFQCFKTLKWDPDIVVGRELTKKFEEVVRGKANELKKREYRGEITLVIR